MNRYFLSFITVLFLFGIGSAEDLRIIGLKQNLREEKEATDRWKQLASEFGAQKQYDPRSYIGKDILFEGVFNYGSHNGSVVTLDIQYQLSNGRKIDCLVYPPNKAYPKISASDSRIMEVFGTVIGLKPESIQVSVNAKWIKTKSAQ